MEPLPSIASPPWQEQFLQTAQDLGALLSQSMEEEENHRRLSKPVLDALRQAGFFSLFLPKSLGGLEADPLTTTKVVEAVSRHNTAAGWALMVANSTTWWGGRLPEKGIEVLYQNGPDTLIASCFHPPMRATRVEGGYLINGRSPLMSNVHEAQWLFVTALVEEQGELAMSNGQPIVLGVFMRAQDCRILDTWYTLGMRATDSNDGLAEKVFVPDHLQFGLVPEFDPGSHFQGKLYKYAAVGACLACLISPVALALAANAIEELKALAARKTPLGSVMPMRERGVVQRKIGQAEALLGSSRAFLYEKIRESWSKTLAGEPLSLAQKADLLLAAAHTVQSCTKAVELMYSAAGSSAIYTRSKLAHYFADAQVIRQHGFVNESRYETVAQVYLGLPPDLDVIEF